MSFPIASGHSPSLMRNARTIGHCQNRIPVKILTQVPGPRCIVYLLQNCLFTPKFCLYYKNICYNYFQSFLIVWLIIAVCFNFNLNILVSRLKAAFSVCIGLFLCANLSPI